MDKGELLLSKFERRSGSEVGRIIAKASKGEEGFFRGKEILHP